MEGKGSSRRQQAGTEDAVIIPPAIRSPCRLNDGQSAYVDNINRTRMPTWIARCYVGVGKTYTRPAKHRQPVGRARKPDYRVRSVTDSNRQPPSSPTARTLEAGIERTAHVRRGRVWGGLAGGREPAFPALNPFADHGARGTTQAPKTTNATSSPEAENTSLPLSSSMAMVHPRPSLVSSRPSSAP